MNPIWILKCTTGPAPATTTLSSTNVMVTTGSGNDLAKLTSFSPILDEFNFMLMRAGSASAKSVMLLMSSPTSFRKVADPTVGNCVRFSGQSSHTRALRLRAKSRPCRTASASSRATLQSITQRMSLCISLNRTILLWLNRPRACFVTFPGKSIFPSSVWIMSEHLWLPALTASSGNLIPGKVFSVL